MLHAVAFAPESCLGGGFLDAPWDDVAVAMQISTYSLKALAVATLPLMEGGGSIVGLDFDNTQAWPVYDWMGVAKSAFESAARYLATRPRPEGDPRQPRVARARFARSPRRASPGSSSSRTCGRQRAPLGWDVKDPEPVAKACVALFSDLFPATTGEMLHVDGGFHAIGA